MTVEWPHLRELIEVGDARGIAAAVRGLSASNRRALIRPLKDFERHVRRDNGVVPFNHRGAMTLAAAGVLSSADHLAPWFRHFGLRCTVGPPFTSSSVTAMVVDVLRARQVPWLGSLASKLAEFRGGFPGLVFDLAAIAGIDPPTNDRLVEGWAWDNRVVEPTRLDRAWDRLLLRTFEVNGVGRRLEFRDGRGLGYSLVTFVDEGRLNRAEVIDLCLGALRRGGRPGDIQGYLAVYTALRPTVPEVLARLRDYPSLLVDGRPVVASMAQWELFRVDDAGKLPIATFVDASRSVFARTEKKLVRAQLSRVAAVLRRSPESTDTLLRLLASTFAHGARDLQEQALDVMIDCAHVGSAEMRSELAAAAVALPPEFRTRAVGAFGDASLADRPDRPGTCA